MSFFPACREHVVFEGDLKNMTEWHSLSARALFKKSIWKAIRPNSCAGFEPF